MSKMSMVSLKGQSTSDAAFERAEAEFFRSQSELDTDIEPRNEMADVMNNPAEAYEFAVWELERAHRVAVEAGKKVGRVVPPLQSPKEYHEELKAAWYAAIDAVDAIAKRAGGPVQANWEPDHAAALEKCNLAQAAYFEAVR